MQPVPVGRCWQAEVVDIELRDIEPDDVAALQALIESDPDYTERVTGHPPGPADAQSLLQIRPPTCPRRTSASSGHG